MNAFDRPDDWDNPVVVPTVSAPERVLVAFDGSHNSERALAWSALVARGASSEVIVLVGYTQPLTMRGRGAAYVEAVRDDLAGEAAELAAEGVQALVAESVRARGIVLKGDVARGIIETAQEEQCELIVMGRQGLTAESSGVAGRLRDLLQGGVAEKVTRHSEIPVLVVP